jgi:hypothetical protein
MRARATIITGLAAARQPARAPLLQQAIKMASGRGQRNSNRSALRRSNHPNPLIMARAYRTRRQMAGDIRRAGGCCIPLRIDIP